MEGRDNGKSQKWNGVIAALRAALIPAAATLSLCITACGVDAENGATDTARRG
jgi:hypothetical protein